MGTIEPNPPLYWLTLRAWMSLAGQSEFAVRFLSILFSTAVGLYEAESGQRLPVFTPDGQRVQGNQIFIRYPFN